MSNGEKPLQLSLPLNDTTFTKVINPPVRHNLSLQTPPDEIDVTGASTPPQYLLPEKTGQAVFPRGQSPELRKAGKRLDNADMTTEEYQSCQQLSGDGTVKDVCSISQVRRDSFGSTDSLLKQDESEGDLISMAKVSDLEAESGEEGEQGYKCKVHASTDSVHQPGAHASPVRNELSLKSGKKENIFGDEDKHHADREVEKHLISPLSNCTDSDSETGIELENKLRAALEILLFPGEHERLEDGIKVMEGFVELLREESGHRKRENRIEKVLREIYRVMTDFPENERLVARACRLLGKITTDVPGVHGVIVSTSGVTHIMEAMKKHTESGLVHDTATYALLTVTQQEAGRKAIIDGRGAECVTHAINRFLDKTSVVTNSSLILGNLAYGQEENKKRIGKIGGIDAVVSAMYHHEMDIGLQTRCCLALRNLTFGSRANQWIAGRAGAMENTIRSMNRFPENKEMRYQGLVALVNMLSDESRNRERASGIDIVNVCLDVIKKEIKNHVVVEHGLAVLRNLSIGNEENQLCIGESGGVQLVMECLKMYRTRERIITKGCSALRYLFFLKRNREIMSGSPSLELLVRILRDGADVPEVAENAILALGNAAFDQYESKRAIARYGGICAVVDVMCNHLEAENLQEYGCRTLRNLADCDEINVRLLGESGAVDAAIYSIMGYKENEDIQEQAFAMLFNIAFSEQNLRIMKDLEVARIVEHALTFHAQNVRIQLQASALLQRLKPLLQTNSQSSSPRGSFGLPSRRKSWPFARTPQVHALNRGRSRVGQVKK